MESVIYLFTSDILQNRYQIKSLLGRKTGRRTFWATDLTTNTSVVIKLLLFGPDFTWEEFKLFEREADTLKFLDHPQIPTYLDSFEVETKVGQGFALVQSYIEARSLQQWVDEGRTFSEEEVRAIATQLLEILDYLHNRQPQVVHRDIKPSNILLGDMCRAQTSQRTDHSIGQLYLVDFGSVQTVKQDGTITIVGTYGYMAPEQFGGRAVPASDLYGLGCTLIYLATAQHPADLVQDDLSIKFEPKITCDRGFIRWLSWITMPDIKSRPQSAKEVLQHFEHGPHPTQTSLSHSSFLLAPKGRPVSSIKLEKKHQILKITAPKKRFYRSPYKQKRVLLSTEELFRCAIILFFLYLLIIEKASLEKFIFLSLMFFISANFDIPFLSIFILLAHTIFSPILNFLDVTDRIKNIKSFFQETNIFCEILLTLKNYKTFVNFFYKKGINSTPRPVFNRELRTIFSGSVTSEYYVGLRFKGIGGELQIRGNRAEIQWLCDELIAWTGLNVKNRPIL